MRIRCRGVTVRAVPEPRLLPLSTGAEARVTNGVRPATVVLANGGQAAAVAGTWSATNEWLVRRVAPRFPELGFVEVRYRVKSWRHLDSCIADAEAAIAAATADGAERLLLAGFSMGGAVCVSAAGHVQVETVVGLAPWLPDRLSLAPLAGRRLAVIHGSLDRGLPGIPGVTAESSRRAFERATRVGLAGAEYTLIRGGLHGAAVRARWGLVPLPRAERWAALLGRELATFAAAR
jgi:dienelactone hydrolase